MPIRVEVCSTQVFSTTTASDWLEIVLRLELFNGD